MLRSLFKSQSQMWKTTYGMAVVMLGTVLTYVGVRIGADSALATVERAVLGAALTIAGVALLVRSHRVMMRNRNATAGDSDEDGRPAQRLL
jgi:hypothetical protein